MLDERTLCAAGATLSASEELRGANKLTTHNSSRYARRAGNIRNVNLLAEGWQGHDFGFHQR